MGLDSHYLEDNEGNKFYPYSHANSTFTQDGQKVGTLLEKIVVNINEISQKINETNNFISTEELNTALADYVKTINLPPEYDDTEIKNSITELDTNKADKTEIPDTSIYVEKVEGKNLSTNDLTDEMVEQYNRAEENVQSDWNVTDENSDAYIKNKPIIPSLDGYVTNDILSNNLANYIKTEDLKMYDDSVLSARIKSIEDDYLTSDDKTEITTAIENAKTEAIETVLGDGVGANFDTLQEIASWIQSDTTSSAELITRLTSAENNIVTLETSVADKVNKITGKGLSTNDLTDELKTNYDSAYIHSQSSHAPSNAEVNQNAFSNVTVGSTTIEADKPTDTLTLVAGSNITLTPDSTNDKITISSTNTTYDIATSTTHGLMSASDKSKLDAITDSNNSVSVTQKLTSGTEIGAVTVNGTETKLYAPTNTDTHYISKNVVGSSASISNITSALTNGNVYLNNVENGVVTSAHKISGSGATVVTTDTSGNIVISSTDTNTDTKVTQTIRTTDEDFPILLRGTSAGTTTTTTTTSFGTKITANPSTGNLNATTFTGELDGNATTATTATKLSNTSAIGSVTQPIYFSASGVPVKTTYTLGASVPSNAKFTDTTYSTATSSADGLMSSTDKTKLNATNIAYGTCSTAAATATKVITISGNTNWELVAGSMITIKFSYTNIASNPTFNVNGTGAKSVWYNTTLITTSSLGYAGTANRPMNFVYDGTQYVFIGWSLDNNTTYSNASLGQGYGTCTTAATTTAKVVTLSNYTLATNGIVAIKFTYAVPASATMNINSKGAKAIYYRGSAITDGIINAGDIAVFIYNGSQYHLLNIDSNCERTSAEIFSDSEPSNQTVGDYWLLKY